MTKWGAFVLCAGALFGGLWPDVRIGAVDEGVTVTVDGQPSAVGAKVSPGLHLVVFKREGYADQELELNVGADEDRELRPEPWDRYQARIDLSALPKDAVASLDGESVSGLVTRARAGNFRLVVTRPDHYAQETDVVARLGETASVALATWEELPGILRSRRVGLTNPKAREAVERALRWLVRHQSPDDGSWAAARFGERCATPRCSGPGEARFDPGVTALAVLALLGAGNTQWEGEHREAVSRGLHYLLGTQDSDGCFGSRLNSHMQHSHVVATMAVTEAWWWTRSRPLAEPVAKAIAFLRESKNPSLGWRYGIEDGDNDTCVTVAAMTALRTAELAGAAGAHGYEGPLRWLEKMTDEDGRTGYQQRGGPSSRVCDADGKPLPFGGELRPSGKDTEALTAAAVFARALVVAHPTAVDSGLDVVCARPLQADPANPVVDLHYAYYGLLGAAQLSVATTRPLGKWRADAEAVLLARQCGADLGCAEGSWDPAIDPFGSLGGRVYSTALATLALQAPTRFPRVWNRGKAVPLPKKPGTK